jgi:predicted nuclease with TOPRIM domain
MDADDDSDHSLDDAQLRAELKRYKAAVRRELAVRRSLLTEAARLEAETSAMRERARELEAERDAMEALVARLERVAETKSNAQAPIT